VGDVRGDLDFATEVLPVLLRQLQDPANFGRFEFMRLVTGLPLEGFYDGTKPGPSLILTMLFATEGRAELQQRAGGSPTQNLDHAFGLTNAEKSYLATLGVDADRLLRRMRARRAVAAPRARRYTERFYEPRGRLRLPLITIHTTEDALADTANERVLRARVEAAGRSPLLRQVFAAESGHCSFTPAQLLAAIRAMDLWVATGVPPGVEQFPESEGFVSDFEPPAWPHPAARMRR
jgi:hypothetical protein